MNSDGEATPDLDCVQELQRIARTLWPAPWIDSVVMEVGDVHDSGVAGFHADLTGGNEGAWEWLDGFETSHPLVSYFRGDPSVHSLIVLDEVEARDNGGWPFLVGIMVHLLAHAVRADLGRTGLYPTIAQRLRLAEIVRDRRTCAGTEPAPDSHRFRAQSTDASHDDLCASFDDLEPLLFGDPQLFDGWAVSNFVYDNQHDLLYYLLVFLFERKVVDAGFATGAMPISRGTFFPKRPWVREDRPRPSTERRASSRFLHVVELDRFSEEGE